MRANNDLLSVLPLQVSLFFGGYYSAAFFIVTLLIFIYKGVMLPYPTSSIGVEVLMVLLYPFLSFSRLYLSSRGNKTEVVGPLVTSLIIALPTIIFHAYYAAWQTYVLRLDQILNGIALVFVLFDFVVGLFAVVSFIRAQRF